MIKIDGFETLLIEIDDKNKTIENLTKMNCKSENEFIAIEKSIKLIKESKSELFPEFRKKIAEEWGYGLFRYYSEILKGYDESYLTSGLGYCLFVKCVGFGAKESVTKIDLVEISDVQATHLCYTLNESRYFSLGVI